MKAQRKHMHARGLLNNVINCLFTLLYRIHMKVHSKSTTSYMPKGYEMNK